MDCLIFDIETTVDSTRLPLFEADLANKAHQEIDYKHGWAGDPFADEIILAEKIALLGATTPEYLCIIGMNLGFDDTAPRSGWVGEVRDGQEPLTERDLLEAFWSSTKQAKHLIGFNCLRFDLPAIYVRSAILGVEPPAGLNLFDVKPWEAKVIDILQKRWPYKAGASFQSLKALRRILQLPIPEKYDRIADMNGGDVGALWAAGDYETCRLYGESDIFITRELCRHWGGLFFPQVLER